MRPMSGPQLSVHAAGGKAALAAASEVLIIKPSSLGDIIHALPAVYSLHQAEPAKRIRWLVNEEWAGLLEALPWLEVQRFARRSFRGPLGSLRAAHWACTQLPKSGELTLALDFQGLLRSALLARAARPAWVMGLSDSREGARHLHDEVVAVDPGAHALDRCLALVQALGVAGEAQPPLFENLRVEPPKGWPHARDLLVLHPWSRGRGKSLGREALQALCDELAPRPVALVGRSEDTWRPSGAHVMDFSGQTTLPQLALVLREASQVVSVDSGPMHLAAAVNPHTLGIHTWSDPRRVGPHRAECWVWKAGCIAHRRELTAAQCGLSMSFGVEHARQLACWLRAR